MTIEQYITKINTLFQTGNAREHSYRGDLQNLLMAILPDVLVTNEPARVACGAPDYVLTRKDIPVGYVEAKDIGVDLKDKKLKEQFDRYKAGLTNLIFTDYMDFHFYKDGQFVTKIEIARLQFPSSGGVTEGRGGSSGAEIIPIPENFDQFKNLIKNFAETISQTIKSPTKLAQMMAGKAKLMADVIEKSLINDDENNNRSQLKSQMLSFQQMLIHDIDNKAFADIYAQTIAYGMFAARYHDPTLENFSREEAATLIPKSNPFLRKLFQDIAGYDLDTRLVWIVDELISIFLASDVEDIMKNFGKSTKQEDPVVHFYETFLGEYNPALRKARGVWYTPQPVVNFMVRAVDDILKTEFNLPQGLADTSKIKIKKKTVTQTGVGAKSKIVEVETEQEVHKVQILDPATGTGTFLAEVVKHIHQKFKGQQGIWSKYVANDLIPRLNGFELLMASYAMAHLKMDMLLTETGYKPTDDQRFRIFLTNSLEEAHPDTQTLFSSWLSDEADQANAIKRDAPVMVVIGNPPYSIVSSNLSPEQRQLIERYKYIDGVKIKEKGALQLEKNLNDDYVKFISLAEQFISKNSEGILAFINNNNFLDAITLRGMRWNLLNNFDYIYIIDAHGNAMKKEVSPNGEKDENIFDIQQGVSINIFVKKGIKKEKNKAKLFHYDLFGKRENKYTFLTNNNLESINFKEIKIIEDQYYFVQKDFETAEKYFLGISVEKLFLTNVTGVKTHRDNLVIGMSKKDITTNIKEFYNKDLDIKTTKNKLGLKDTGTWNSEKARNNGYFNENYFEKIHYRPFDNLNIYYDSNLIDCNRINVMKHFINGNKNIGLVLPRQAVTDNWSHIQVTNFMIDNRIHYSNKGTPICCPLYLYPEKTDQPSLLDEVNRTPNLNMDIVNQMAEELGIYFNPEEFDGTTTVETNQFTPLNILDYIYAVLHSPTYREKYKEFLKIDFPRVPYPTDIQKFYELVALGGELRQIHLLESETVENYITEYPEDGDNVVGKPKYVQRNFVMENDTITHNDTTEPMGRVYINETQYFDNVPEVAWNFYIGGYQPAQKWLKDRKERELSFEDILHYQKIIVALSETDRIMKEIDTIEL
nr:type ISP restriction/modification enzyme [uncultured Flavobacterium sp.]